MVWKNVCLCVYVSGHTAVPQELDTPGLPYLACTCIHSFEVATTSTH